MCEQFVARAADPERDRVGAVETTSALVHLRRPSRLSTLQMPDAQPCVDPVGRFAFSQDAWTDGAPVAGLLEGLHGAFGGSADLAVLEAGGGLHHDAGNPENRVFAFRLGRIGVASTALYSIDRSLFRYAAQGATDRSLARLHCTIALDERGRPIATGAVGRSRNDREH